MFFICDQILCFEHRVENQLSTFVVVHLPLGQQLVQSSSVSEETSKKIEKEVRRLIQKGMDDARKVMTKFHDQ